MDKQLWRIILKELQRQQNSINLIPSENYADLETLFIVGSPLMNKYSEGYPQKRYYPGTALMDKIEMLSIKRALRAFKLDSRQWSVNVQPYSGSPANLAAYLGLLNVGDKIMGLNLFHGGHLTHGHQANHSGKLFTTKQYCLNLQTEKIDYNEIAKLAYEFKPRLIISGTTAYPRIIDFSQISKIAKKIKAYHLADISHIAGLIIANLHPSPFHYADIVTTTTHKTLQGPRGAVIFMKKDLEKQINRSVFPGLQGGPHMQTIAAIAYTFKKATTKQFLNYQKQIIKNAKQLSLSLINRGFRLYSGGTENHLMIIDLKPLKIDGKKAEKILELSGIIANRNALPNDISPFNPSGIRLGTPAVTARGMEEKEMEIIAELIYKLLIKKINPKIIKKTTQQLCSKFPLPYHKWYNTIIRGL
ncbi:MAG: serine hydroxymethyltransferase [Candidatus Parcubacteria bacterium]|nr:MAG: serine hydroxymethyltransferase [Candidatus Parcubacteria bacterium]